jgi:hypothetical protein
MTDNIFTLVPPKGEKERGYVKLTYNDYREEIIQSDTFGQSEDFPNFVAFYREDPDEIVGFYSNRYIRKIEVLDGYNPSESN